MKRYSISLGNFATEKEALGFFNLLIKNYAAGWNLGQPTICPQECDKLNYIEEFEADENFCKVK